MFMHVQLQACRVFVLQIHIAAVNYWFVQHCLVSMAGCVLPTRNQDKPVLDWTLLL